MNKNGSREQKKIVVVGDGACGKTSLLFTFINNEFPAECEATVFENYAATVEIPFDRIPKMCRSKSKQSRDKSKQSRKNLDLSEDATSTKKVELMLFDTAGQEEYEHIIRIFYQDADVVILCYSIGDVDTFHNAEHKWIPEIRKYSPKNLGIMLVGTKSDLRNDDGTTQDGAQYVSAEEGLKLAYKVRACAFKETSAKTMMGVNDVFIEAAVTCVRPKSFHGRKNHGGKCHIL